MITIVQKFMPETRIAIFINKLVSDPKSILNDESVEQRMNHISLSVGYFISDCTLPHGFTKFITYSKRIMSGYGAFLYEMGIIGAVYILYYFRLIWRSFNFSTGIAITIVMFSAIQVGNPMFALLIGYCLYTYNQERINSEGTL